MKKNIIIAFVFLFFNLTFSQEKTYSFKVEKIGKGKPILLIPGLASSGDVWNETTNILKNEYECHVLTLPGFASQKPIALENGYLPEIQNEIITYIKNELEENPILIGHSLGGFLSLSIAVSNDELLEKIVILDSYPFMPAASNPNVTEESIKSQANKMKNMWLHASDSLFIEQQKMNMPTMITKPSNIKTAIQWALDSDRETMSYAMYELMTTDLRNKLHKIKTPILVLGSWYAVKDYGITKEIVKNQFNNQYMKGRNVTIKMAETARHFIMLDNLEWFLETLNDFINNKY